MVKSIENPIQPVLFEFPIQNNRTGWHPVWTPTLAVCPWSFNIDGSRIPHSQIQKVVLELERLVEIKVAGHPQEYPGIGIKPESSPDRIVYSVEIPYNELLNYKILPLKFISKETGESTDNPQNGDYIEYTNARGINGRVEYFNHAEYFDLSMIEINVDNLPSGRYIASWSIYYFKRVLINDIYLFCIDDSKLVRSKLDYPINHPGEVHEQMVNITPHVYVDDVDKKSDFTINLYRPFADALQDIFDESELFYGINWASRVPPELLPYLAYLIGVDLPIRTLRSVSIDKIRRNMLLRGTELQKAKGTELAIKELFSILGFSIKIINLWSEIDGTRFIAPNDDTNKVISYPVRQTDILVANYNKPGFGGIQIPLMYHNNDRQIVLSAFVVEENSQTHLDLKEIYNDMLIDQDVLMSKTLINTVDNYLMLPDRILDMNKDGIKAYTRLVISDIEVLSETHSGLPIIKFGGTKYDPQYDKLDINFAGHKDFESEVLYIFATYSRNEIEVDESLENLVSNRFDLEISSKIGDVESGLYDYLIDSLNTYKAFHSLLRKVIFSIELNDYYNVTDFCSNSYLSDLQDGDMKHLQVPPAHLYEEEECTEESARGGSSEEEWEMKLKILEGLEREYTKWYEVTSKWLDIAEKEKDKIEWAREISNIDIPIPDRPGDNYGQDRVSSDLIIITDKELEGGQIFRVIYNGDHLKVVDSEEIFEILKLDIQELSPLVGIETQLLIIRQVVEGQYYVRMLIDTDYDTDIRSKIVGLDPLFSPDYCYKGRVYDDFGLTGDINLPSYVRNKPCNLMMGLGVYYYLKCLDLEENPGWHGDLLSKSDTSLHFSDDLFLESLYKGSLIKHSLEIEKFNNNFPGHRYINYGLKEKFVHPAYRLRPWDVDEIYCGIINNPLNSRLVKTSYGQQLIFDDADLFYDPIMIGENIDIEKFDGESENKTTHSIYSTAPDSIYVDLDNTIHTSKTKIAAGIPVFDTSCTMDYVDDEENILVDEEANILGYNVDYIDGYWAEYGDKEFKVREFWSEREIGGNLVIESDIEDGDDSVMLPATYSSEVKLFKPSQNNYGHRFDCECNNTACNSGRNCNDFFKETETGQRWIPILVGQENLFPNGEWDVGDETYQSTSATRYDFNNDRVNMDLAISHKEIVDSSDFAYDGKLEEWMNWDFNNGKELNYMDEYGTQYYITFEETEATLDITYEVFTPRIPGEEEDGYFENGKVFRKGVIDRIREFYEKIDGEWVLINRMSSYEILYKQMNYSCDIDNFENKFLNYFRYKIREQIQMAISKGPQWCDPHSNNCVEWSEINNGGFEFIDAWSTYQI